MKEWTVEFWNSVMDHQKNPLSNIPDFATRHMIMQVLAWMWCIVFGIIVSSMWAGVISMILHIICLLYTSPSPRDRQKSRMPSSA